MNWLRKSLGHLLAVLFLVSLLGIAVCVSANRNLSQPDKLKGWLSDSKIYDNLIAGTLEKAEKDEAKAGDADTVSLSDATVQQAAEKAFSPQLLQQSVNTFLDANYAWLQGKTPTPSFTIDLTDAKATFAQRVGKIVGDRLASLPACTPDQLAKIQIPVDPLTVTCRPASLDPTTEAKRVTDEITASDFLSQPEVTASSLGRDENSQDKPYYEKLAWAPTAYKIGQKAPLILAALAILLALLVIFLHPEQRKGIRKVAFVMAFAGILLVASKYITDFFVNKFEDKLFAGNVTDQLQTSRSNLLEQVEAAFIQTNLWFGIAFLILAAVLLIWLFQSRERRSKVSTVRAPQNPSPAEQTPAPAIPRSQATRTPLASTNNNLAPASAPRRRQPTMDIMGPSTKPQPKPTAPRPGGAPGLSSSDLPKLKKPRPRGPRLIQ
jgi:hypothetical protein